MIISHRLLAALHNVVSQTKEPISNHQEQEGLGMCRVGVVSDLKLTRHSFAVIKKTRKSLNEGFDCLVTRSEDLGK